MKKKNLKRRIALLEARVESNSALTRRRIEEFIERADCTPAQRSWLRSRFFPFEIADRILKECYLPRIKEQLKEANVWLFTTNSEKNTS